jgi:primase-polymerase (primpol)-like protein
MDSLDFGNIAPTLKARPQWLVWRFEEKPGDKKPRKVPYYASGSRRMGQQGSDADREKLVDFITCLDAAERRKMDGIGFAFLPGDGLIGIDIDGAIDLETGEMSQRAQGIIKACASYTELSPSGKGVHIVVEGETKSFKSNDIGLEVF